MKNKILLFMLATLLLGLVNNVRAQEKVYFPYFEMINVENDAQIQLSTSKLLKTYIEENHNYQIIIPKNDGNGVYPKEDFLESIENAKRYDAKYVLIGEINNIGKLAILSMSLYEVSTGNKVWNDLIKGLPLDDYDPVISRVGRNFGTSVKANDDANLYDVTAYEEQREMKLLNFESISFTGLELGGNYLFNETLNTKIGLNFFHDISSVILHMGFEYSSNTMFNFFIDRDWRTSNIRKNRTAAFGMGVSLPFTKTKNALYADAGLEFGLISQKDGNPSINYKNAGLGFSLGAGYLIGRNSTSNIRFYTGISLPAYKVENRYIPIAKFGIITSFASSSRKR
jgi:hypothetical protein